MQSVYSAAPADWASWNLSSIITILPSSFFSSRLVSVQVVKECCEQYWTSPGGNTPQGTNYTATFLPSRKLSKLDEPDMQDTAGEAGTSS